LYYLTTSANDPISVTPVGRQVDGVAIGVGWRQGDTIPGIRGLEEYRRGMTSRGHLRDKGREATSLSGPACCLRPRDPVIRR
jgi:hypothetical protein